MLIEPKIIFNNTVNGRQTVVAQPQGVCSQRIDLVIENGIIQEVEYTGGCSGNTQGLAKLLKGMPATEAIERLEGIDCNWKGTSCPDQLAKVLKAVIG